MDVDIVVRMTRDEAEALLRELLYESSPILVRLVEELEKLL